MPKQYLFIGASAAAIAAMNKLLQLEPTASITCITQEIEFPYNKCFLADYLAGQFELTRLEIASMQLRERVHFIYGTQVIALDVADSAVICENGAHIFYDALLLAMGSSPSIPSIFKNASAFTFHTLRDTQDILASIQTASVKRVLIVGAGLSGLECADALHKKGITITILERNNQVLGSSLSVQAAAFLQQRIAQQGMELITSAEVVQVMQVQEGKEVTLSDRRVLHADMIVCATGLQPNSEIAIAAGIASNNGAIIVNDCMQTNIANIYAAGDLIEVQDQISGKGMRSCTWPDAMLQGIHAVHAMAGMPKKYAGPAVIISSSFFDLKYAQAGFSGHGNNEEFRVEQTEHYYHEFIISNGKLKSFLVLGNNHNLGNLRRALLTGEPFSTK